MKKMIVLMSLVFMALGAYRFGTTAWAADAEEPICVVTHIDAMPNFTAAAHKLLLEFVDDSRKDDGAIRVEAFEQLSRPNHSTVVEIWKSRKAYEDHLVAGHTRVYRAKLQPMLGSPFDERLHRASR